MMRDIATEINVQKVMDKNELLANQIGVSKTFSRLVVETIFQFC